MSLVHIHGNYNSGNLESTLTPLASLNVILDALVEHIMASFLLSSATMNTTAVILSDPYGLPIVVIHRALVNSNITQSIAYEISKLQLLQYWANKNLTHMADWEVIDPKSFKRAQDKTTAHMAHFITKCMSNTLPTMKILQQRGHKTTNRCPHCGVSPQTI